jgi:hypothetical protein
MRSLLLLLALAACSSPRERNSIRPRDVGPRPDAGAIQDASAIDGSDPADGGPLPDGSDPADASFADASDPIDASAPDALPADTGVPPLCTLTCSVASDCVPADNALQDADNWMCTGGTCLYRGCLSSSECTAVYGAGYTCVQFTDYPVPTCVESCTVPSDCVSPSPLFDTDNFQCFGGGCRWAGCNSDSECQDAFADPTYVCEAQTGLPFLNCVKPCSFDSDCTAATLPAFDADNYSCTNARCRYLGCFSTAECEASFTTGMYECR